MTMLWIVLGVVLGLGGLVLGAYLFLRRQALNEDPAYWEGAIARIERRYGGDYPQDVVVFLGSSSIRFWRTLVDDLAPIPVVNHGFGGSKIKDSTYYLDRLVFPFSPKAVVLFAGTNDINEIKGSTKTGEQVYGGFVQFVAALRETDPDLPLYYVSITPTRARWAVWQEANLANKLIAEYAGTQEKVTFIDTTETFLGPDGTPNRGMFKLDGLHPNKNGYRVWTSIIKPVLIQDLGYRLPQS
jgi:lysophospholipase L1-like esterase